MSETNRISDAPSESGTSMAANDAPRGEAERMRSEAQAHAGQLARFFDVWQRALGQPEVSAEESEARAILDRVERDLPVLEARIDRLMHQYGM